MGTRGKLTIALLAVTLTACALGDDKGPYVYIEEEYNRDRADFGREPKDRTEVQICYNSLTTTPEAVRTMAVAECAKYGKVARLTGQQYLQCALSHPVRANYACEPRR